MYDLCWSSDGRYLLSGSVDNSALVWDIHKGKKCVFIANILYVSMCRELLACDFVVDCCMYFCPLCEVLVNSTRTLLP